MLSLVSTPKRAQIDAQVAQAVERSPEKAGVGGSTPSLGTICMRGMNQECFLKKAV
jgi:hypothetical protein